MEKYKQIVKVENIRALLKEERFDEAVAIADSVNFQKIKSVQDMNLIASAYQSARMYEMAISCYQKIYDKSPTRKVLIQLIKLSIKLKLARQAQGYLDEYEKLSPEDYSIYIYKYSIAKLKGAPINDLIAILKGLCQHEYIDKWAYELVKLYYKSGKKDECIRECNDIILWFGYGEYVDKAKALLAYYNGELSIEDIKKQANSKKEEERDKEKEQDNQLDEKAALSNYEVNADNNQNLHNDKTEYYENYEYSEDTTSQNEQEYSDFDNYQADPNLINENYVNNDELENYFKSQQEEFVLQLEEDHSFEENKYSQRVLFDEDYEEKEKARIQEIEKNIENNRLKEEEEFLRLKEERERIQEERRLKNEEKLNKERQMELDRKNKQKEEDILFEQAVNKYVEEAVGKDEIENYLKFSEEFNAKKNEGTVKIKEEQLVNSQSKDKLQVNEQLGNEQLKNEQQSNRPLEGEKLVVKQLENNQIGNGQLASEQLVGVQPENNQLENAQLEDEEELEEATGILVDFNSILESVEVHPDSRLEKVLNQNETTLEELIGRYVDFESLGVQLIRALDILLSPKATGLGAAISGSDNYSKQALAKGIAKLLYVAKRVKNKGVVLINSEKINDMDLQKSANKFRGYVVLIQNASKLSEKSCEDFLAIQESINADSVILLEDEKSELTKLFRNNPNLSQICSNRIHMPSMSLDILFRMTARYFISKDYLLDEKAAKKIELLIKEFFEANPSTSANRLNNLLKHIIDNADKRYTQGLSQALASNKLSAYDMSRITLEDIPS